MKTFRIYKNKKNNIMNHLTLLFSLLIAFNASAMIDKTPDSSLKTLEEIELENIIFESTYDITAEAFDINFIEVIELEEEVEISFDTKKYLPEGFNPLKGMHDLDWSTIELIELEEEVDINFDTNNYLPDNFNPYKGMHSNSVVACLH